LGSQRHKEQQRGRSAGRSEFELLRGKDPRTHGYPKAGGKHKNTFGNRGKKGRKGKSSGCALPQKIENFAGEKNINIKSNGTERGVEACTNGQEEKRPLKESGTKNEGTLERRQ